MTEKPVDKEVGFVPYEGPDGKREILYVDRHTGEGVDEFRRVRMRQWAELSGAFDVSADENELESGLQTVIRRVIKNVRALFKR